MLPAIMAPKIQFLLLIFGIVISVGHAKPPNKITKSYDAPHTPYQVSLIGNQGHFCGGSIIDRRHILTAAHCLINEKKEANPLQGILIGTNDQMNRNQNHIYGVVKSFVHEGYSVQDSAKNDIAILKVNRDIIFNESQHPISLPISDTSAGTSLTLTGWGETRDFVPGAGKYPQYLRTITTHVISQNQCQQMRNSERIKEGQICTWTGGQGSACHADSGGPLVHGPFLVGIVSFGDTNCAAIRPDVFTRVYYYVPWIQTVIAQSYLNSD